MGERREAYKQKQTLSLDCHGRCSPLYVFPVVVVAVVARADSLLAGAGFHPHLPGFKYNLLAKGLGATMWFFIFYRARSAVCYFPRHPIEFVTERMAAQNCSYVQFPKHINSI